MIHWRYTKGLNQDGNGNSLYTFLSFKAPQTDNASFDAVPELLYSNSSNGFGSADTWGHVITQKATGQSIDTEFTFNNNIKLIANKKIHSATTDNDTNHDIIKISANNDNVTFGAPGFSNFDFASKIRAYAGLMTPSGQNIVSGGDVTAGGNVTASSNITAGGKCEAIYFNATSDSRAKTDLAPLSINALDLIKRVQLYSFKYKDSKLPSIGILAQDVKDVDIEGFKLVDNEEASGIDMDYMSIHESKLIYILWKAIQEQQKEIDDLKAQLGSK